jgi:hypothetical protein
MKITPKTLGAEHILAIDERACLIGGLVEVDTETMEGRRVGYIFDKEQGPTGDRFFAPSTHNFARGSIFTIDHGNLMRETKPIKIAELIDGRTGKQWKPETQEGESDG